MAFRIVTDETDLRAIATRVLPARSSRARIAAAEEALAAANPTLVGHRLVPGGYVVLPFIPGARVQRGDVVAQTAADLVGDVQAELADLLAAAQAADRLEAVHIDEVARILGTVRATGPAAALKDTLDVSRGRVGAARDHASARADALAAAATGWRAELAALAGLMTDRADQ